MKLSTGRIAMAPESYYGGLGKILENGLKIVDFRVILGGGVVGSPTGKLCKNGLKLCILELFFVIKTKHFCL